MSQCEYVLPHPHGDDGHDCCGDRNGHEGGHRTVYADDSGKPPADQKYWHLPDSYYVKTEERERCATVAESFVCTIDAVCGCPECKMALMIAAKIRSGE